MTEPVDDDVRHDDLEFNPSLEPTKAKAWLNLLKESEDAFEKWNDHCDKIDKQHANLDRLANMSRDKEFQMFWANAEVIKPSIQGFCRNWKNSASRTRTFVRSSLISVATSYLNRLQDHTIQLP